MRKALLILQLFISVVVFGQASEESTSEINYNTTLIGNVHKNGMWIPAKPIDNVVEGSSYLFSNWAGQYKLITKKGESRQIFNLNYNLKTKELESSISKDSVFQFDLNQFDYVLNATSKYKVINDSQLKGLFLEIYNTENVKLFKETAVFVKKGVLNPLTQTTMEKDVYVQKHTYYLVLNGSYHKIKLNKGDVLKLLNGKKAEIKAFVSKNNLDYSSENDISMILNYYNSL